MACQTVLCDVLPLGTPSAELGLWKGSFLILKLFFSEASGSGNLNVLLDILLEILEITIVPLPLPFFSSSIFFGVGIIVLSRVGI